MAATTAEPDLSRTARAAAPVPRRPAPGLVREGSSQPTPLFSRHTRGVIEAERDRRRQRRARGAIAPPGMTRERDASAAAAANNSRAATQAHLDMERWINEGGLVPFEAATVLRATTSRR